MRIPALLLALLLLPAAAAQDGMAFTENHQVRIAFGDIPSTEASETPFQWNFEETILASTNEDYIINKGPGHQAHDVDCDCDFAVADEGDTLRIRFLDNSTPEAKLTYTHYAEGSSTWGAFLGLPDDALVLVYTAPTMDVAASVPNELPADFFYPREPGSTDPTLVIHQYHSVGGFWFTVFPAGEAVTPAPVADGSNAWMWLLIGLLIGAGAWYALVRFGYVQKRQRKQVAGEAAHKVVAKTEPKTVLEGRKRVLMAALKELEMAKMNKEIDTEAYDALKADFKRQTVTVMRALEEAA